MNWVTTCLSFYILTVVVHCSETNAPRPLNPKSNNGIKSVVRRTWRFEQPQTNTKWSSSPIFRSLSKTYDSSDEQQLESFEFYPPNYAPIPVSPEFARSYGYHPFNQDPATLYMDYMVDHWMREAHQRKQAEQQKQRNNGVAVSHGGINGAIYIPALANGAFGGPITVLNQQGQQSQEELVDAITTVGNVNSVESSPTVVSGAGSTECRSGLQDYEQRPYYLPQFRSSFYPPQLYDGDMGYYSPPFYPRQLDYLGNPYSYY